VRDGVLSVVKIGVVLLIATSWPAYRTVVYDVIVKGPAQLSAAIAGPSRLPGVGGDLVEHLQVSDNAIARLTTLGSGRNDLTSTAATGPDGRAQVAERAPIADDLAFGSARVLFLASVVAAFAVVRLGAGILLALAPLFAGLLLFDIGRGLFIGWARALVFTMLASVAVTVILAVELSLLEPWLTQVLRLRYARIVTPEAPIELLVMCAAFALALAGSLALILRLAFMIDIRAVMPSITKGDVVAAPASVSQHSVRSARSEQATRASGVAGAVAAAQRRETAARTLAGAGVASHPGMPAMSGKGRGSSGGYSLRSSFQALRRTRPRKSLASGLRDLKS
jgi:type IV secretion system protein VirB6